MTAAVRAVYFIQASNGLIKIGSAANPFHRLNTIRTNAPLAVELLAWIPGAGFAGERELHARFADLRSHGEWFQPAPELLAFIASIPPVTARPKQQSAADPLTFSPRQTDTLRRRVAAEVRAEMAFQRKTQADLAGPLGISVPQVGKRLSGQICINIRELDIIAKTLGVPLVNFLPAEPEPAPLPGWRAS